MARRRMEIHRLGTVLWGLDRVISIDRPARRLEARRALQAVFCVADDVRVDRLRLADLPCAIACMAVERAGSCPALSNATGIDRKFHIAGYDRLLRIPFDRQISTGSLLGEPPEFACPVLRRRDPG